MDVFSPTQASQLGRQTAGGVSPTSFPDDSPTTANGGTRLMPMPNSAFDMDSVIGSTERNQGTIAVPTNEPSQLDLLDPPYQTSISRSGQQNLVMKLIASGVEVPDNLDVDLFGDPWQPQPFQIAAITDAVRGEVERQLVVESSQANPLEFSGFLAPDFPRQQISTQGDSLEATIEAVNSGGGWSKAENDYTLTTYDDLNSEILMQSSDGDSSLSPPTAQQLNDAFLRSTQEAQSIDSMIGSNKTGPLPTDHIIGDTKQTALVGPSNELLATDSQNDSNTPQLNPGTVNQLPIAIPVPILNPESSNLSFGLTDQSLQFPEDNLDPFKNQTQLNPLIMPTFD